MISDPIGNRPHRQGQHTMTDTHPTTERALVTIDVAAVGAAVAELGAIGEQPGGGLIRPQYSAAWAAACDHVADRMRAAGLAVRRDSVGNVFGRLAGVADDRTILTGSHLDTVRLGGKYDGALGVITSLAAVGALRAQLGTPARSIEVVALCEEEGSRFHANYFGSRAILGLIGDGEVDELRDEDGTTLADAMRSVGLDPARTADSARDDIDTFLELHIEQGPNLVEQGLDIGVVTAITALSWFTVTVTGRADHAGTTPMDVRRDAMQGAARMVSAIADVAARRGRPAVATMGVWDVQPGGANIVPEQVTFSLDMRHADAAVLTAMIDEVRGVCRAVADDLGLQVQLESVKREAPAPTDTGLQARIISAAERCGASWRYLPSGAGHDTQPFASRVPSAMVFVPSVGGRSHSAAESTPDAACALGAQVLAETLRALSYD